MTAVEASYSRRQTMGSSFEDMSNYGGILKQKATKIRLQDKEWPIARYEEGPVQDLPVHHHARRRDPEGSLGFEREEGSGFRKPD